MPARESGRRLNDEELNERLTSWKCVEAHGSQRSVHRGKRMACHFKNLYFVPFRREGIFVVHVLKNTVDVGVFLHDTVSLGVTPGFSDQPVKLEIATHGSLKEFGRSLENEGPLKELKGLTVVFCPVYHFNIGHAIWDGFYPAFVSMLQFGKADTPANALMMSKRDKGIVKTVKGGYDNSEAAYQKIAGLELLTIEQLENSTKDFKSVHRLEQAIMGIGTNAQKLDVNANFSLGACRDLDACRAFRNRIFNIMNLEPPKPARVTGPFRTIIIDNKRYGKGNAMEAITEKLKADKALEGFDIQFVSWSPHTDGVRNDSPLQSGNFTRHMEIIGSTDVHISGPGTAMMYQAFLPDGAVHVNLGINKAMDQGFMEEYVAEGSPHLKALYYPRRGLSSPGLEVRALKKLILKAGELLRQGWSVDKPTPIGANLSPVGQVYKAYTWLAHREKYRSALRKGLLPLRTVTGEMWMGNRFPEEFVYNGLPNHGKKAAPDLCLLGALRASFDANFPKLGVKEGIGWFGTGGRLPEKGRRRQRRLMGVPERLRRRYLKRRRRRRHLN